jgi:hypothetical protein
MSDVVHPDDPNPEVPKISRGSSSAAGGCLKFFLWTVLILFLSAVALFGLVLFMCSRH